MWVQRRRDLCDTARASGVAGGPRLAPLPHLGAGDPPKAVPRMIAARSDWRAASGSCASSIAIRAAAIAMCEYRSVAFAFFTFSNHGLA